MKTDASIISLALALAWVGVGCSGPMGPAGPAGTSSPGNDRITGHWQYVSGPMVVGATIDQITYLDLNATGSGTLLTHSPNNAINGCGSLVFSVLNEGVVAAILPDFPDQSRATTQFYEYALPSSNELKLTDAFGNVTTFHRATAIPTSATCSPAPVATPVALPQNQAPYYASGLASDSHSLWYSPSGGGALPLNPATGATGTLVSFAGLPWVQAIQGSDFWSDCFCGMNSGMERRTVTGTLVSNFDLSAAPIRRPLSITAASYDGANLWVGGYQSDIQKNILLKLNANVAPPSVLAAIPFDTEIQGMAFKSGHLWSLTQYVGPELVDVDPATGAVRASYTLPRGFYYQGLAALNGVLYALRFNRSATAYDILPIPGL